MSDKKIKKTVEDWVSEVNYTNYDAYIPSSFALEFVNFIKMVNGADGEEHKTPIMHMMMLDQVAGAKENIANLCYRGAAKTTVMAEYLFLYLAVYGSIPGFGEVTIAIYVSDSIENGVKNMRKNLEYRWENSPFLQKYVPKVRFTDVRYEFENIDGKKLIVKGYGAKALSLDSKLFTDKGMTTIANVKVGDKIFGADGYLATVTKKSEVFNRPMYQITLEDGRTLKVSDEHINSIVHKTNVNNKASYIKKDLYTHELLELPLVHSRLRKRKGKPDYTSNENLVFIENCKPLEYTEKHLLLDPYTLGLLLGDGSLKRDGSCTLHGHVDDMKFYKTQIPYELGKPYIDKRNNNVESISIKGISQIARDLTIVSHGNFKRVPSEYFFGSIKQRLALLAGLLDTDGTIDKRGRISFTSNSEGLVDDVANLCRSLGGTAKKHNMNKAFRVELWLEYIPFKLKRKALRFKNRTKHLVAIKSIIKITDEPSQCIAIDNEEHQFIANEYFRTHNTGVRGAKEQGRRVDLAILDDLISDDDARSPTVIKSIEDTVYKAIDYALHPTRSKVIWSGTPFNQNDPLYKAIESGGWYVNVYPVCEHFDSETTEETFVGAWPDRHDFKYVKSKYDKAVATGQIDAFNQELMLRIMSDEDRLIKDTDIVWYSRYDVLKYRSNYNFYITTDFATSEKTSADFSVISVWAYNNNGDWLWVDGIVERQTMDKNLDDLFRFATMYKPDGVGIEVTGQQGGFIQWIREQQISRNIFFKLTSDGNKGSEGIRPNTNKMVRFNTVVPLFKNKKIWFPKELKNSKEIEEAINELRNASPGGFKSKHDDFIDTISMLSVMNPWKPSTEDTLEYNPADGVWEDTQFSEDTSYINSYIV